MKYKFNTNNVWTMLCFMLFLINNLVWVYFQFGPPYSALLIDLVAMRRKFYNIIQCKDTLDSPFHYNNGCTFKWFLEHNNELVCIQTLMPTFPARYSLRHDCLHFICIQIVKRFTFSRVLKYLNTVGLVVSNLKKISWINSWGGIWAMVASAHTALLIVQ